MNTENRNICCLSIAGFDPSGGAGIHADLKVFHTFGVYGAAATTLIAVQNSRGVSRVEVLTPDLVREQIEAVVSDFPIHGIKLGALGNQACLIAALECIRHQNAPVIYDPVVLSSSGAQLLSNDALIAVREIVIPRCYLITPNLDEAHLLTGSPVNSVVQMKKAAEMISEMGAENVLITGGHLSGEGCDLLLSEGVFTEYVHKQINTPHTHGTGCALSAAITACVAKGIPISEAVEIAKVFVNAAIETAPQLGSAAGPINLLQKI